MQIEDKTISQLDLIFPSKSSSDFIKICPNLPIITLEKLHIVETKKKVTKTSKKFKKVRILAPKAREILFKVTNLPESVRKGDFSEFYHFEGFLLLTSSSILIIIDLYAN